MTGTTVGIWVIVVVVVLGLAVWLGSVALAARHPQQEHPQRDPLRGLVQGGQHVGGGRSVAPTRDAPVPEDGGTPPTAEEEDSAAHADGQVRRSGNPMDLLPGTFGGFTLRRIASLAAIHIMCTAVDATLREASRSCPRRPGERR